MSHVFVSYSSKDSDFVKKHVHQLQRTYRVWWDKTGIHGGEDWEHAIKQGVESCSAMVVVLSSDAATSDYVRFEYETALKTGKPVIPVMHKECDIPVRLRKQQVIQTDNDSWFEQVRQALQDSASEARIHDSSYLVENQLIGNPDVTFGDLLEPIQGSFRMDRYETNLVALPLLVTQHAMTYLVGQHDRTLHRVDDVQLALQCSQGYESDNFPVQVASYVLGQEQPLHMILVRGPMRLNQHPTYGIQMVHGLDNDHEDEWRGVVTASQRSVELYNTGTTQREMVHVFNIAPAALLAGFGMQAERGRGMTFYNFVTRNQYSPVFTVSSQ